MDEKDSFQAALKRAREVAAKMQVNAKLPEGVASKKGRPEAGLDFFNSENLDNKKKLALQIANNLSRRLPKDLRVLSEGMDSEGRMIIHLMIPTILVCLFGGRDNETLKWMQEKTHCKMEMHLEHKLANSNEKPLTVIGEPDRVEAARELVKQYIREKDEVLSLLILILGVSANNMQVSLGIEYSELLIPKEAVGLVIGKQGENIKKVNNDTGCIVKFRPLGPRDDERFRVCTFHGTAQQIKKAREQLSELVETLKQKFGLARPIPKPGEEFAEVRVSAAKAGVVIGKGGETIKQINNLSGAIVCIDRSIPDGSEYRIFFVVGTHDQVEHAKYLIREKSGEDCDIPAAAILALNPLADPYFNQAPITPLFAAPLQPQTPSYPCDPTMLVRAPFGAPVIPQQFLQPQYQQPPAMPAPEQQDYSAAWASYYQQYYPNYPSSSETGVASSTTSEEANAYWQQYYQYYQQNPEYYQQYHQYQSQMANVQPSTSQPHPTDSLSTQPQFVEYEQKSLSTSLEKPFPQNKTVPTTQDSSNHELKSKMEPSDSSPTSSNVSQNFDTIGSPQPPLPSEPCINPPSSSTSSPPPPPPQPPAPVSPSDEHKLLITSETKLSEGISEYSQKEDSTNGSISNQNEQASSTELSQLSPSKQVCVDDTLHQKKSTQRGATPRKRKRGAKR